MSPQHPLAALYLYGACGFAALYTVLIITRRHLVESAARDAGIPPGLYRSALLISGALLWPVIVLVQIARYISDRRGGRP